MENNLEIFARQGGEGFGTDRQLEVLNRDRGQ